MPLTLATTTAMLVDPVVLEPAFADLDVAVLGRADFFRHFRITFEAGQEPHRFHLDVT